MPLGRCQPPKHHAGRMQDTTVLRYGCFCILLDVWCIFLLPLHVPTHCCMDLDYTCRWCVLNLLIAAVVVETREWEPPCPSRLASTRCQAPRLPRSIKPVRLRVRLVPTACKGCPLPVLLECMAALSSCLLQHAVGSAVPGTWTCRLDGWSLAIGGR